MSQGIVSRKGFERRLRMAQRRRQAGDRAGYAAVVNQDGYRQIAQLALAADRDRHIVRPDSPPLEGAGEQGLAAQGPQRLAAADAQGFAAGQYDDGERVPIRRRAGVHQPPVTLMCRATAGRGASMWKSWPLGLPAISRSSAASTAAGPPLRSRSRSSTFWSWPRQP